MTEKLDGIVNNYLKNVPQQVGISLPKLNSSKPKNSEPAKVSLPKLKKITSEVGA